MRVPGKAPRVGRDGLRNHVRDRLFGNSAGPPRIGLEVEFIPIERDGGTVPSVRSRLLPFLRAFSAANGWTERPSEKGAPRFALPSGGAIALEPGGQLEYASPPFATPGEVLADVAAVLPSLIDAAAGHGLDMVGAGIDPHNSIEAAPLQLLSPRYAAMDAYFRTIGPAGARMMRQTAALQINIDPAGEAGESFRLLKAAAPWLVAIFANSRRYAGVDTGHASFRSSTWRLVDPSRTGIVPVHDDVAASYADWALAAPVMLPSAGACPGEPFPSGAADLHDWEQHLSTLFPEVRPKGYLEVRSVDALPLRWLAAPVLLVAGLTRDRRAAAEAAELIGVADPALLEPAGRLGLAHPRISAVATDLFEIALNGCRRQADCGPDDLEIGEAFLDAFTRRGRSPSDEERPLAA